ARLVGQTNSIARRDLGYRQSVILHGCCNLAAKKSLLWTRTFLDKGKSKIQNFCVRAHQGAFLETILKRSRNAVPAGPVRNRTLGRLRGSAGRYYGRPAEPS